jgi:hypothetical protein
MLTYAVSKQLCREHPHKSTTRTIRVTGGMEVKTKKSGTLTSATQSAGLSPRMGLDECTTELQPQLLVYIQI